MIQPNGYDGYDEYAMIGQNTDAPMSGWNRWTDGMDWLGLREEVQSEVRAEIILMGLGNAGKSTLFNSLRGWPVMLTGLKLGRQAESIEERTGLFTLVDLPEGDASQEDWVLQRVQAAALLVYLLDGAVGRVQRRPDEAIIRPADCRWIGRLRATGVPLLVVLNKADLWADQLDTVLASVERRLGLNVIPISAYESSDNRRVLLDHMVETCPSLAVPLGREVAAFRRAAAKRVIRKAVLMCGLAAMQPVPLVDLPMQVGTQVGLVARISTIYDHPPSSDYCKELILTGAGSMALRLAALQVAKLVPVVGWIVSGLLGATTTWVLGQSTVAYYEGWAPPAGLWDLLGKVEARSASSGLRQWTEFVQHVHPLAGVLRERLRPRKGWWSWRPRSDANERVDVFVWGVDE